MADESDAKQSRVQIPEVNRRALIAGIAGLVAGAFARIPRARADDNDLVLGAPQTSPGPTAVFSEFSEAGPAFFWQNGPGQAAIAGAATATPLSVTFIADIQRAGIAGIGDSTTAGGAFINVDGGMGLVVEGSLCLSTVGTITVPKGESSFSIDLASIEASSLVIATQVGAIKSLFPTNVQITPGVGADVFLNAKTPKGGATFNYGVFNSWPTSL